MSQNLQLLTAEKARYAQLGQQNTRMEMLITKLDELAQQENFGKDFSTKLRELGNRLDAATSAGQDEKKQRCSTLKKFIYNAENEARSATLPDASQKWQELKPLAVAFLKEVKESYGRDKTVLPVPDSLWALYEETRTLFEAPKPAPSPTPAPTPAQQPPVKKSSSSSRKKCPRCKSKNPKAEFAETGECFACFSEEGHKVTHQFVQYLLGRVPSEERTPDILADVEKEAQSREKLGKLIAAREANPKKSVPRAAFKEYADAARALIVNLADLCNVDRPVFPLMLDSLPIHADEPNEEDIEEDDEDEDDEEDDDDDEDEDEDEEEDEEDRNFVAADDDPIILTDGSDESDESDEEEDESSSVESGDSSLTRKRSRDGDPVIGTVAVEPQTQQRYRLAEDFIGVIAHHSKDVTAREMRFLATAYQNPGDHLMLRAKIDQLKNGTAKRFKVKHTDVKRNISWVSDCNYPTYEEANTFADYWRKEFPAYEVNVEEI